MPYTINDKELADFCRKALVSLKMQDKDAVVMSNLLVEADKWGLYTHGTKNLYGYICIFV